MLGRNPTEEKESNGRGNGNEVVCVILDRKSRKVYLTAIGVLPTSAGYSGMIQYKPTLMETLVTPCL